MKALRNQLNKLKPHFEEGGKLHGLHSVFDGFETFLFVPNRTSQHGVHVHDAIDSKRTMIVVCMALLPALLFGMYNVGGTTLYGHRCSCSILACFPLRTSRRTA